MRDVYRSLKPKVVPVDVEGTILYVRSLTFGELTAAQSHLKEAGDDKGAVVTVLHTACDQDGIRVFKDDELAVVETLPVHVLAALARAASGLLDLSPSPKA